MADDFATRFAALCDEVRKLNEHHGKTREQVAACEQKDRDINGSISRIEESQRRTEEKLDALCEAFAGWKGSAAPLLSAGSALVGAVVAMAITYLKTYLLTGGTP